VSALGRTLAIARKEVRHLRRDRLTLGMIVGIPALQLALFGYAINQDVRHLPAGVADLARTQASRRLVEDSTASQVIDVVARVATPHEIDDLLRRGRIRVGLVIPADFDRRVLDGTRPAAQLVVDASDPTVLQAARRLTDLPLRPRLARGPVRASQVKPVSGREPAFVVRAAYNPEGRSEVFIVPGLVGVILTLTMVLFTSVAIVRERERGNLEMLITTPVRRSELMVGKVLPYVLIGVVQVDLVVALGVALFGVPVRGSLLDLHAGALLFITASLALGLLISTLARTQFQAFQVTMFTFLPSMLLSGFMFPFEGMPRPAQVLAEVLPLTHFVRIARGILLRDATIADVGGEAWPLGAFLVATMALAILRFRKRLD
jgi:ABC-2 type transport system permease protein